MELWREQTGGCVSYFTLPKKSPSGNRGSRGVGSGGELGGGLGFHLGLGLGAGLPGLTRLLDHHKPPFGGDGGEPTHRPLERRGPVAHPVGGRIVGAEGLADGVEGRRWPRRTGPLARPQHYANVPAFQSARRQSTSCLMVIGPSRMPSGPNTTPGPSHTLRSANRRFTSCISASMWAPSSGDTCSSRPTRLTSAAIAASDRLRSGRARPTASSSLTIEHSLLVLLRNTTLSPDFLNLGPDFGFQDGPEQCPSTSTACSAPSAGERHTCLSAPSSPRARSLPTQPARP